MSGLSIRTKLILSFALVALMVSIQVILQIKYNRETAQLNRCISEVQDLKSNIFEGKLFLARFISSDLMTDTFHLNKSTDNSDKFTQKLNFQRDLIEDLKTCSLSELGDFNDYLDSLTVLTFELDKLFFTFKNKIIELGYKDYGITGDMRNAAHGLEENFQRILPLSQLLSLRRYEKDFIIRKDLAYQEKFNAKCDSLANRLLIGADSSTKKAALLLLKKYQTSFNKLCTLNKEIGLDQNAVGVKNQIQTKTNDILGLITIVEDQVNYGANKELARLRLIFYLSIGLCTVITVFVVFKLASLLSRSILELTNKVKNYVHSNFEEPFVLASHEEKKDEIGELYQAFKKLSDEVSVHFKEYKLNAERKHSEVLEKTLKIEEQKVMLERKGEQILERNKSLMDSILYAKRIQSALFPNQNHLNQILGENLFLFRPKAVVSGDFYWVEETNDSIYFAVGDCTGHGVPGAFMSILGFEQLSQTLKQDQLCQPGEILNHLSKSISSLLNQEGSEEEINDGMDIILCRYIKNTSQLQYSGANRPLLLLSEGKVTRLPTHRTSIGGMSNQHLKEFDTFEYELTSGEILYLTTDGFADQFGGHEDKKIKRSGLISRIESMANHSIKEASQELMMSFLRWKGNREQIDDVCILGIQASELLNQYAGTSSANLSVEVGHLSVRKSA